MGGGSARSRSAWPSGGTRAPSGEGGGGGGGSGADGVIAAVDVDHLAGGGGEPVRAAARTRTRRRHRVVDVPTQRGPRLPRLLERRQPGIDRGPSSGWVRRRPGSRRIPRPPTRGPGSERWDSRAALATPSSHTRARPPWRRSRAPPTSSRAHQRPEGVDQSLQRVRRGLEGHAHVLPGRLHERATEADGSEADGEEDDVHAIPAFSRLRRHERRSGGPDRSHQPRRRGPVPELPGRPLGQRQPRRHRCALSEHLAPGPACARRGRSRRRSRPPVITMRLPFEETHGSGA